MACHILAVGSVPCADVGEALLLEQLAVLLSNPEEHDEGLRITNEEARSSVSSDQASERVSECSVPHGREVSALGRRQQRGRLAALADTNAA